MGKKRTWTTEQLREAVKKSPSYRQVLAKLKLREAGGNYEQLKKYIEENNFSTKHFKGKAWNKGLRGLGKPLIPLEKILIRNSTYQSFKLKKRLFQVNLKSMSCEECGWSKKSVDNRIPLELDHINGDRHDNRLENLRILCPNCHSLQLTHRGKNRDKNTKKIFI
ncbi:MAG TPA: HNH endonuclease signature motif containing protein [Candidatus Paceibacterota bacterium]